MKAHELFLSGNGSYLFKIIQDYVAMYYNAIWVTNSLNSWFGIRSSNYLIGTFRKLKRFLCSNINYFLFEWGKNWKFLGNESSYED